MAKDVRIIPASGEINFNENGLEKATVYQLGNDIHIAPIGTIYLGDGTAANLQLGDEATSVDIQFLGGGTITSTGGTLSIGSIGDVVNINAAAVTCKAATAQIVRKPNIHGEELPISFI